MLSISTSVCVNVNGMHMQVCFDVFVSLCLANDVCISAIHSLRLEYISVLSVHVYSMDNYFLMHEMCRCVWFSVIRFTLIVNWYS